MDCVDGREEKEKPFTKKEGGDLLCLPNKQSRSGVGFDIRVKSICPKDECHKVGLTLADIFSTVKLVICNVGDFLRTRLESITQKASVCEREGKGEKGSEKRKEYLCSTCTY